MQMRGDIDFGFSALWRLVGVLVLIMLSMMHGFGAEVIRKTTCLKCALALLL